MWESLIGAYQVMEKYLKDRKGRKLSLDEINHYMKVAKAIRLTIELQGKVDSIHAKIDWASRPPFGTQNSIPGFIVPILEILLAGTQSN